MKTFPVSLKRAQRFIRLLARRVSCASLSYSSGRIRMKHSHFSEPLRTPVLASVLLLSIFSCSAEEDAASENSYFQELPVVLTASRLSQPLSEAPSETTVIDRAMIKASGFRTVPELMRLVPGMYVGFVDANHPVVSLHGATDEFSRRMQVMIDGRSVYLPPMGGVNWADLPLQVEDIERIEIVRGPSSAAHGTNSFYGVINIITRDASALDGGSVSVTGGGASDASAKLGKSGKELDYRFSVGYRSDQGLDNAILNDHNATRTFNLRSNYHPNATDSLDVQFGGSNGVYGMGIAGRPENAFRDTTSTSSFGQLSWLHQWAPSNETKLTYSQTSHRSLDPYLCINTDGCQGKVGTQINPLNLTVAQSFIQQNMYSQRNQLELQNTNQMGDNNRLVWGAGTSSDYADYSQLLGQPYTLTPWRVFAHDEWHITQATVLNIGTMLEDDGMGSRNNSPRASLNYHFTPEHTVRFGISSATRSPAMAEAYIAANNTILGGAYLAPATPLAPEKVLSKEIGYLGEFRSLGVTVDARAYIDTVTDMIVVDKYVVLNNPYPDSLKNMMSAEYRGVETTVKYHWNEAHSFLSLNYAYQQASASLGSYPTQYFSTVADPTGVFATVGDRVKAFYQAALDQFPQTVPTHSGNLLLSQQLADNWQLSAGYYYRGAVRVLTVTTDVTGETTMRRLDLRLAKTFKLEKGRSVEMALVVQNATRDDYTNFGTVNASANVLFARRGWLTATLNF